MPTTKKRSALEYLPEITRRLLGVSDPERIILFGSYARGDHSPDSDLDLLVVIEGINAPRKESNRLRRSLRGLLIPVDILVTTPENLEQYKDSVGLIYRSALSEGKVIYERPQAT